MTTLEITLPDSLAKEAKAAGLLAPEALETMLREAMRKRAVDRLFQAMDRMAQADVPPMTEAEIQAEIDAVRAVRVVLDTNIVVSGLLWHRAPRAVLDAARDARIDLFASAWLLDELSDVLPRAKLQAKVRASGLSPGDLLAGDARLARQAVDRPARRRARGCRAKAAEAASERHGLHSASMKSSADTPACFSTPASVPVFSSR